ncbi:cardiolipin synthase [Arenibaculum pallidiluteum]|uniref:cardiolipin synthase n=1 Tax=Arenibaculum pallidiluteum TaxID=2812559 RepID=UPI001A96E9F2|nr:cardiolipin synthase [Arenibaculum pallidiluteum]
MNWSAAFGWLFSGYVLLTGIYIVLENRRPPATFAWMLLFLALPGAGLAIYLLFGRDRKAFSRENALARQNLKPNLTRLLGRLLDEQEAEIHGLEADGTIRHRLMRLVRRNSHSVLTLRNRISVQQDAAEHYPSLVADLKTARHSIHLQYYIWAEDPFTQELKEILIERAQAGVEVRLLYDPVGSFLRLSRRYRRELRQAGVLVAPVSPLYRLHTISYRNHRKIAVIDGRIGYTGGLNIGQEHIDGGPDFDVWRDTHLRIVGDGAAVLETVFLIDWYNATGEDLYAPDTLAPLREHMQHAEDTADPADEDHAPSVPVQILTSGPDSEWRAIRQLYFAMILSARRRVRLQSPFFILDPTIAEALKAAALSGVEVEVMLSARGEGLNQAPYWAASTYLAEVTAAGVRAYLYEKGYLHAKVITVDGQVCSVGSANLDIRSFSINYEATAVVYDPAVAAELDAAFERDLAGCRPFLLDEYLRRPVASRLRDSLARLLSPLL